MFAGYYKRVNIPDAPTNLQLTEVDDKVEVEFDLSDSPDIDYYEIWSSVGGETDYALIATISKDEIDPEDESVSIIDETYDTVTTIYYKVFAIYQGNYSASLDGNIVLAYSVPDPTSLTVKAETTSFTINYVRSTNRLLESVLITKDAQTNSGDLDEGNATEIYEGLASGYTYEIPVDDYTKWHQFWISSVTRTD